MEKPDPAADLGKKLGRAFKAAKPRMQRFVADAKPHAEKARDEALKFAREHEDEGRQLAQRLVRARLRGPLAMAFDTLAAPVESQKPSAGRCESCGSDNAVSARFCSQCGAALTPPEPPPGA